MPRIARVVVPGVAHHVTQRGNRREDIFFRDADRQRFLQLFLDYSQAHSLSTLAYCLMSNHVHIICIPKTEQSLAATFKPVNLRYAQHVNWTGGRTGRLWQGRFFSCALDDEHLWTAIRYVERNPVRAKMAKRAEQYPWSSAAAHCGLRTDPLLPPLPPSHRLVPQEWSKWLAGPEPEPDIDRIRLCTRTGRPAADKDFVAKLEATLGRPLLPRPPGRPRKGNDIDIDINIKKSGSVPIFP